jgi:hypothetical protein
MVVRTILKLWLLVRERKKGDNSNLVSAVLAYLDTGKYPAWICGCSTFKNYFGSGIRKTTNYIAFLDTPWSFE